MEYRLAMPEPHTHLLEVEARIANPDGAVDLVLPSWTPGSYLLREFARHVQDFEATSGDEPAPWRKLDKSTWRVDAAPGRPLTVRYRVYANELTVRTSHLDASHAYVNGASVFLFARGHESAPHRVEVAAPRGWQVTTALTRDEQGRLLARDYDHLVDSPLEIGTHRLLEWEQSGRPHRYAVWGGGELDGARLVADTREIVAAAEALFGELPYDGYTFILHLLPEGRGGLEHRDSSSLQADRSAMPIPGEEPGAKYEDFLALVAHEFFHVWNAKRIRPETLGPFDYTAENYTRSLWVVEGLTTYYTDLLLLRAGRISAARYLERLAESIARFQSLPGRLHQSLDESSFDTWIRFYRPDEHTPNSQVSYYHKGALVGLLLDLEIRHATDGARSLDDVMRLLWERYGARDVGFPESGEGGAEAIAEEVAGTTLRRFFDAYLRGTDELDIDRALRLVGLHLTREPTDRKATPPDPAVLEARLGIRARERSGRLEVAYVLESSPGWHAGLNAGDELIALDGFRVTSAGQLAGCIRARPAGEQITLAVFRRDELLTLMVPLGPPAASKPRIAPVEDAGAGEARLRTGWLGEGSLDPAPGKG